MIVLMSWLLQDVLSTIKVRVIPYSEFKRHLSAGEVNWSSDLEVVVG